MREEEEQEEEEEEEDLKYLFSKSQCSSIFPIVHAGPNGCILSPRPIQVFGQGMPTVIPPDCDTGDIIKLLCK